MYSFQTSRGLRPSGVCDRDTWSALFEASWTLGDRVLRLEDPPIRGDDVVELQRSLSRIGFDSGRVDGIFAASTERALRLFQRNSGLPEDGACDPETVDVLRVMLRMTGDGPGVIHLREIEHHTANAQVLSDLRLMIGQFGGLSEVARGLVRSLRKRDAVVISSDKPDTNEHATSANRFGAAAYIGFEASETPKLKLQYWGTENFESARGRRLATAIAQHCLSAGMDCTVEGMRLPILRETRMPAVLIECGNSEALAKNPDSLIAAIVVAAEEWAADTDDQS